MPCAALVHGLYTALSWPDPGDKSSVVVFFTLLLFSPGVTLNVCVSLHPLAPA